MTRSLKKAFDTGMAVHEVCLREALTTTGWVHRNGGIFAHPDLGAEIRQLWPLAKVVPPIGILTDVDETMQ